MATLNKLAIRGIRSFDDKQISVIEFFNPVTVIVGHNGSGKTTIIECLKYATTGDQPPNTRGGAFIHDPKMANEKEVKAQVKLRFHAANGTRMLAVRNLSVTVKKTGLTMKTLENILALADGNVEKGGKRGVISTKCAEIDQEIPHLLGVSKSVLDNVIFCHQEDSYWPLAEASALKKKFDEIFEATRYTKALDSIKALRKEREAELKADKERLESLLREKTHADKLKSRISDLNSTIAAKEVEYEEAGQQHQQLVSANQRFYEQATKFREVYLRIQGLQENIERYRADLAASRENLQEVEGTDDELQIRLQNFDRHVAEQKQKRRKAESTWQDLEDELAVARKQHVGLVNDHGALAGEAKAQEVRLAERETLIREISEKHGIKGFNYSPLEREKVIQFMARLDDLNRRQKAEFDKAQSDSQAKNDEYNHKARALHTELQGFKLQKDNLRQQISDRQSTILKSEKTLEDTLTLTLPSTLLTLQTDISEKRTRLEKTKTDARAAAFEEKIAERGAKGRVLEERREEVSAEMRGVSLQADARARLDLKRGEVRSKTGDVGNTLESVNAKFRKMVGKDARVETMERDLERVLGEKERECGELEAQASAANKALQQAETTLSGMKAQLKGKQEELKGLEKSIKAGLEDYPHGLLDEAIKEATEEVSHRNETSGTISGASSIYESLLRAGHAKKVCTACNRHLNDQEFVVFEKYLKEQMKKTSPETLANNKSELEEWEAELSRLQGMRPLEATRIRLKTTEIPGLLKQIQEAEAALPGISETAEDAAERLTEIKKELKDLVLLKQPANHVTRTQAELVRLAQEIANIESDLSATGSTKTAEDIQEELSALSNEIRANEREKQLLQTERERQSNAIRTYEKDLHEMEMRENTLTNRLREKAALEESVETMKKDIAVFSVRVKELDVKISAAQAPIERLEQEHNQMRIELNAKIEEAQRFAQELAMSVDKIENTNKAIERYVREKRAAQLQECGEKIEQFQAHIKQLSITIEGSREVIARIDKEINESGASVANLRENIRVRKLAQDIVKTQAEIDSYDMEEAAKSKRNFETKYNAEKKREADMQNKYAHIGGELSSHKSQLKTWEQDLKEFKDINKRYTEQLIKVKMSDMANSDLEKYAKALDNAIMKYHGLKMEEVNDTMRHLWNKTYQGTDIDGIKIRSDVEGGASRRSYNYRVVMTKDRVEMDMRGRCSAGQKMLASIIIRLALSDSFGQNCGILALDEPTNALDTENIDALAGSLVDIINERKNYSNFQLIIITHDENFLRKLGQSDVMEYYWRVSRDTRQKSIIERQRFR